MTEKPLILWFRRDLRLSDHPMLTAAVATGRPLIPVFILDPETEAIGAAPRFRLGLAIEHFAASLEAIGARLVLRRGPALAVLQGLIAETGAAGVMWSRAYDPASKARDQAVKASLKDAGLVAESHPGALIHEPWTVQNGQGAPYKVYTPFWKAVRGLAVPHPAPAPKSLRPPASWPRSDALGDWALGAAMRRGAAVVAPHQRVGEARALARLEEFAGLQMPAYTADRDFPGLTGATSGLSENLAWGEIGPRVLWHRGWRAMAEGVAGAEHFLKEVIWREFAWHLMHHFPHMAEETWKPEWRDFPWRGDNPDAEVWRQGRTGEPFVDAAMREMYVTGRMHNRARMIVASYLTKHLLTDWRVGLAWFADCLTDWDPAANAMGWQWVAGSGPDAAPYFRIFNPSGQAEKFDADQTYRRRWIAELSRNPPALAQSYFAAVPKSWGLVAGSAYPMPRVDLGAGRARALDALAQSKQKS
jgi:deoxyribodipyrimidine photo-lyase